jgi:hypothetical protein
MLDSYLYIDPLHSKATVPELFSGLSCPKSIHISSCDVMASPFWAANAAEMMFCSSDWSKSAVIETQPFEVVIYPDTASLTEPWLK